MSTLLLIFIGIYVCVGAVMAEYILEDEEDVHFLKLTLFFILIIILWFPMVLYIFISTWVQNLIAKIKDKKNQNSNNS